MDTAGPLADLLAPLSPDQLAAVTADAGPVLCVAPAGSGKTTTLIARIAWRIDQGVDPREIAAITFNARAAEELRARIAPIASRLGVDPATIAIRTFHALGRAILADAGQPVDPLLDRATVLRAVQPGISAAGLRGLDDAIARLKLDAMVTAADVAADPDPGPLGAAFVAYEQALADAGGLDFDDLVVRALRLLRSNARLLDRWRGRCRELFVDEVQDVDRSQLQLALLLAEPTRRIFLVGDDDQTIYGWRLADVRRVLRLADALPGLRRHDLVTNCRCPPPVVERAARLVAVNRERFAKDIRAAPGASGRLVLAPDPGDDAARIRHVLASWPDDGGSQAILARTNRELLPAMAVLLEAEVAFRADGLTTPLTSPVVDRMLALAGALDDRLPLLVRLQRARLAVDPDAWTEPSDSGHIDPDDDMGGRIAAASVVVWAAGETDGAAFAASIRDRRDRLARLCRADARLSLATIHATKGLEFDHVAVIGLDEGRFPSGRSIAEAADPDRALEEERRLAYVAWTRARRSLTLVYDPANPSRFMIEAFSPAELDLPQDAAA